MTLGGALWALLFGLTLALVEMGCATVPEPEPEPPPPKLAPAAVPENPLPPEPPAVPPAQRHGVVVGDVSSGGAVLWSRAEGATRMEVQLRSAAHPDSLPWSGSADVEAGRDHTARLRLTGLEPGTRYRYLVRMVTEVPGAHLRSRPVTGSFRTPPEHHVAAPVSLAFGGDLAGQNVCRDAAEGFPVFGVLKKRAPDVFIALGDMIYADGVCREEGSYGNAQLPGEFGPAADLEAFWAHWRYAREDQALQEFFSSTSSVAVWDDHEVLDDFGPQRDQGEEPAYPPDRHLMPLGLGAFLDYNPIAFEGSGEPESAEETQLHRRLRWGRHLELFVLDTRQHRDPGDAPDTRPFPKTMLGSAQREWLLRGLIGSDATWKVVVSSVPISIPTGSPSERGRDGWADLDHDTGYERELRDILDELERGAVRNQIWITTDVHFAAVFRYTPFERSPRFQLHEIVTGPLQAGLGVPREFDTSLGAEALFLHGVESYTEVTDFAEARRWFNFGELEVDASGRLTARIIDGLGQVIWETTLSPR